MRIAKCLVLVLVLAAVTYAATPGQTSTREASCIVRITADSDILPLNLQMINHLMLSSAVAGQAAQDVFKQQADDVLQAAQCIQIEWLAQSSGRGLMLAEPTQRGRRSRSSGQSRDEGYDEMMKQLAEIYGDRYTITESPEDPAGPQDAHKGDTPQTVPDGDGMGMGGYGGTGGYGGMMGGGMGGMMSGGTMGGGMGGMMGGGTMGRGMSGMGGMGGGMMGRGPMGFMGGTYGAPLPGMPSAGTQQSAMVRLSVQLPEEVEPAAEQFLVALVENLRQTLRWSYEEHVKALKILTEFAESRRDEAEKGLNTALGLHSPERRQLEEQLDMIVDLSMLSPDMPFSEAIKYLRHAVDPPLPIVVLWKELLDSCDIEPTTPIDIDGLERVRLGTALKTLVAAVGGANADISYQIDDDVIVVREEEAQTPSPVAPVPSYSEIDVRALSEQRRDLQRTLQRLEMDLAVGESRRRAIEEQIAELHHQTRQKLEADVVTQELQKIVDAYAKEIPLYTPGSPDVMALQEKLARVKIELVQRREALSKSVGGNRLSQLSAELSQMAIDAAEKRTQIEFIRRQLAETEDQLARSSTFDPQAARIRTAREALDIAEAQVTKLKTRLASLQFPTVTVIAGN